MALWIKDELMPPVQATLLAVVLGLVLGVVAPMSSVNPSANEPGVIVTAAYAGVCHLPLVSCS
jgi:hypothetical protein